MVAFMALTALALSVGWPALTGVPEPATARLVLALTSLITIVLAAAWQGTNVAVLVALGLGFPAVFVRELARPAPRPDLVRSVAATSCGVMAAAVCGLWVSAAQLPYFRDLAIIAGAGVCAACVALGLGMIRQLASRPEISAVVGVVLAGLAGAGLSVVVGTSWWAGLAVAAACAVAPGAIWLVGQTHSVFAGRLRLRDAALLALPLAVAAVPVWAAQLMR
jgi:hypothetical protein